MQKEVGFLLTSDGIVPQPKKREAMNRIMSDTPQRMIRLRLLLEEFNPNGLCGAGTENDTADSLCQD